MRRTVAVLFFVLGCLLAVFAVAWLIAAEIGVFIVPTTAPEAVVAFIVYAILMFATLDRFSVRDWSPVLAVTHSRILLARWLLSFIVVICLAAIAVAVVGRALSSASLLEYAFSWVIGSLLLLNGVYVALHWAYWPNNLFGPHIPPALLNPLGLILVPILKATGVVKSPGQKKPERNA